VTAGCHRPRHHRRSPHHRPGVPTTATIHQRLRHPRPRTPPTHRPLRPPYALDETTDRTTPEANHHRTVGTLSVATMPRRKEPDHGSDGRKRVALITGAARGQGRSHAVSPGSRSGADIIAVDICDNIDSRDPSAWATADQTRPKRPRWSRNLDRRIVTTPGRRAPLGAAESGDRGWAVSEFGHIDVVCANAGIASYGHSRGSCPTSSGRTSSNVNLTGVWRTIKGRDADPDRPGHGRVDLSSPAPWPGRWVSPGSPHYTAAKHAVMGLNAARWSTIVSSVRDPRQLREPDDGQHRHVSHNDAFYQ